MARCTRCGESTSKRAGFENVKVDCTSSGCSRGWKKCTRCIYSTSGFWMKWCNEDMECSTSGKRKCSTCKGTGTKTVKMRCSGSHRG